MMSGERPHLDIFTSDTMPASVEAVATSPGFSTCAAGKRSEDLAACQQGGHVERRAWSQHGSVSSCCRVQFRPVDAPPQPFSHPLRGAGGKVRKNDGEGGQKLVQQSVDHALLLQDHACNRRWLWSVRLAAEVQAALNDRAGRRQAGP